MDRDEKALRDNRQSCDLRLRESLAFAGNKGCTVATSTSSIEIEECSPLWLGGSWFRDVGPRHGCERVSDGCSLVLPKDLNGGEMEGRQMVRSSAAEVGLCATGQLLTK